ncbi:hypothetical protein VTN49DRAFT_4522 [Thermomyces lanuginosus]|uniref:uncharacterized protein n=1 Tax=Thermomyces lanuginosus TaxID=5541 RepID=UPI0037422C76
MPRVDAFYRPMLAAFRNRRNREKGHRRFPFPPISRPINVSPSDSLPSRAMEVSMDLQEYQATLREHHAAMEVVANGASANGNIKTSTNSINHGASASMRANGHGTGSGVSYIVGTGDWFFAFQQDIEAGKYSEQDLQSLADYFNSVGGQVDVPEVNLLFVGPETVGAAIWERGIIKAHRAQTLAKLEGKTIGQVRRDEDNFNVLHYVQEQKCVCVSTCSCADNCTNFPERKCPCASRWLRGLMSQSLAPSLNYQAYSKLVGAIIEEALGAMKRSAEQEHEPMSGLRFVDVDMLHQAFYGKVI